MPPTSLLPSRAVCPRRRPLCAEYRLFTYLPYRAVRPSTPDIFRSTVWACMFFSPGRSCWTPWIPCGTAAAVNRWYRPNGSISPQRPPLIIAMFWSPSALIEKILYEYSTNTAIAGMDSYRFNIEKTAKAHKVVINGHTEGKKSFYSFKK